MVERGEGEGYFFFWKVESIRVIHSVRELILKLYILRIYTNPYNIEKLFLLTNCSFVISTFPFRSESSNFGLR